MARQPVDLADPVDQFTAIGIGNLTFTGIAVGTFATVVSHHGMSALARLRSR